MHLGNQISSGIDGYKPLHILALHYNEGKSPAVSPESSVPLLPSVTNEVLQDSRGRGPPASYVKLQFPPEDEYQYRNETVSALILRFPHSHFSYMSLGDFPDILAIHLKTFCENASPGTETAGISFDVINE